VQNITWLQNLVSNELVNHCVELVHLLEQIDESDFSKFHTLLEEKVLYRTLKDTLKKGSLGFHTWPIEPFTKEMVLFRTIFEFHI